MTLASIIRQFLIRNNSGFLLQICLLRHIGLLQITFVNVIDRFRE